MKKSISDSATMFEYGRLVDAVNVHDAITSAGFTFDDLKLHINAITETNQKAIAVEREKITDLVRKYAVCPDCGAEMKMIPALGAVQTRFACTQCDLALDSRETPGQWIRNFMEKEKDKRNVRQITEEKQAGSAESGNGKEAGAGGDGGKVGEVDRSTSDKSVG